MNRYAVIFFFLTSALWPSFCLASGINLSQILLTRQSVSQLDWKRLNKSQINSKVQSVSENKNDSSKTYEYGKINYLGVDFDVSADVSAGGSIYGIHVAKNIALEESQTQDFSIESGNIYDGLVGKFGNPSASSISKIKVTQEVYMQFNSFQWTLGGTRLAYLVVKFVNKGKDEYSIFNLYFAPVGKLKELKPVTFLSCNNQIIFPDGDKRDLGSFIFGIDYNSNKVINEDYFTIDFNLDDKFITKTSVTADSELSIIINRATGEITGHSKRNSETAQIKGQCQKISDKNLF